jgi:hypothetical protein
MGARGTAARIATVAAGAYALVWLFETPRGDRLLQRADRALFPRWVTGDHDQTDQNRGQK